MVPETSLMGLCYTSGTTGRPKGWMGDTKLEGEILFGSKIWSRRNDLYVNSLSSLSLLL
jgi:acyl-coenzyme A synthetase/AMP-(fatty) acid ligase